MQHLSMKAPQMLLLLTVAIILSDENRHVVHGFTMSIHGPRNNNSFRSSFSHHFSQHSKPSSPSTNPPLSSSPSMKSLRLQTSSLSPSRTASILQSRRRRPHATRTSTSQLGMGFFGESEEGEDFDEHDIHDEEDEEEIMSMASGMSVEKAREQYESMMSMPDDNVDRQKEKEKLLDDELHDLNSLAALDSKSILATKTIRNAFLSRQGINSPPPLTAILRERRLKEIQLIGTLAQSDKAINELWALWIAERGATAAATLLRAEELMSVESWHDAEQLLLGLIDEHGVHWAEPVNRLATLYYMQARYEESKVLCEIVLDAKPWHFGALSGIVLVCTAMNDASGAREWANKRLPPLLNESYNYTRNDRRSAWTMRAIDDAKESLRKASLVGRSKDIGAKEVEFRNFRAKMEEKMSDSTCSDDSDISGSHSDNNRDETSTVRRERDNDAWQ